MSSPGSRGTGAGATATAPGPTDTATVSLLGDGVQHVSSGQEALCELSAPGIAKESIDINILSPSKVPVSYRLKEHHGLYQVIFRPDEVGTYVLDVYAAGRKTGESPVFFKVYDSSLIRVSDLRNGVVGQPSQFRVDASQAGEGQLEISINDGEVPNHVQVLGGGRCLVHFSPEQAKPHTIDIKFNGEPVPGCPFVCQMADTSKVSVALHHLELMCVHEKAQFQIHVDTTDNAELAVSVTGPRKDVPVQVTGNVKDGFVAAFVPDEVGPYVIGVEYNNVPVGGTPFTGKAYDSNHVIVSPIPWGTIGKSLEFTVDASRAGEGNLEITISARGRNIPTQVHPQGSARFAVSFVPLEAVDHVINITFNKDVVPGAPFVAKIHTDPNRILVSGQSLAATAVGRPSTFTLSNVVGSASDLDIVIDSPSGEQVDAKVIDQAGGTFDVRFTPEQAGEHQIYLSFASEPIPGSPFACKVYDVDAIQVRECKKGIVGKPVTFLVETSRAGPGNLEVTVNNGQVPTSAQAQGNHTYAISFVPKESKPHIVELKFNGENVPGSPFKCAIADAAKVNLSGDGLEKVPVGQQATFFIEGQFDMGDPEVKILAPNKRVLSSSIRFIGEGHFAVDYTPVAVGDHQVEVKMGDVQVQGSPFVIKAYDVSRVVVSNITSGHVGKQVYFSIDASQAGAGNLEIIVSVNGKNVPNYVQSEGNAKFRVNFKPMEANTHMLSVKFNNEFVPNSPFACEIAGSKAVALSGPGITLCPAGKETSFTWDSSSSSYQVVILSPSGQELPFRMDKQSCSYTPKEVGPHMIRISSGPDSVPVEGSPFTCNVYDVDRIRVDGLPEVSAVGQPVTFTVDASKAGEGTLELVVTTAKTSVRAEVSARSRGLYDVTFVPQEQLSHYINITFNEEHIQNSPFQCQIVSASAINSSAAESSPGTVAAVAEGKLPKLMAVRGKPATFVIDAAQQGNAINSARILDPNGRSVKFEKVTKSNGNYSLKYVPQIVGPYTLLLEDTDEEVVAHVHDPGAVRVLHTGPAVAGQPNTLVIDTSNAGRGALSVAIKAAGYDIEHSIRDIGKGRFEIAFIPTLLVTHKLDVKYNSSLISDKIVEVQVRDPMQGKLVTASGLGLYQARVNSDSSFIIDTLGRKSNNFDVVITGPAEAIPPYEAVPLRCYQQKDGNLLVEFQTATVGVHKIEVLDQGRLIHGAPFHCNSFDPEAVTLRQLPDTRQELGKPVQFQVDRRQAGQSDLDVIVTSPLGEALPVEVKALNQAEHVDLVEFLPEAEGKYQFVIRYGGEEIADSPVSFVVAEPDVRAFGMGLQRAQVNSPASFEVSGLPEVEVIAPDSSLLPARVTRNANNSLSAVYTPNIVGKHLVVLRFPDGRVVRYPSLVSDPSSLSLLRRSFNDRLVVGAEATVTLAGLTQAGPGKLEAELTNLDVDEKQPLDVAISGDRAEIRFRPSSSGDHSLSLRHNGFALPFSPLRTRASGSLNSPSGALVGPPPGGKVRLTGLGLLRAVRGQTNAFTIDGSQSDAPAGAAPKVTLKTEDGGMLPVHLRPLARDVYEASYVVPLDIHPSSPLSLNVTWGGRLVKGCPLKIRTDNSNAVAAGDDIGHAAAKVFCSGEGLTSGTLGKDICSFIDTRQAGPGELSLHCVGPRGKTAYCELNDHQDGTFTLNLKPQESGRHQLSVKYGGHHVPGSPFCVRVSGAPDPDKVKVYGPGVDHGVLAMYQSRFICDTRGAGAGQLTVRIRGPKGAFRVEMQRESQKDRTILCKYEPTEPGDYRIEVKWSGQHVPGSPFGVMIFDTQEELARFLQTGGGYSPPGDLYGSIGHASHYGMVPPWMAGPVH